MIVDKTQWHWFYSDKNGKLELNRFYLEGELTDSQDGECHYNEDLDIGEFDAHRRLPTIGNYSLWVQGDCVEIYDTRKQIVGQTITFHHWRRPDGYTETAI